MRKRGSAISVPQFLCLKFYASLPHLSHIELDLSTCRHGLDNLQASRTHCFDTCDTELHDRSLKCSHGLIDCERGLNEDPVGEGITT